MKLLSWFDVRRIVADKSQLGSQLPKDITCIRCFPDGLKIGINSKNPNAKKIAVATLTDWFGEQFDGMFISLEIAENLPVEFIDSQDSRSDVFIHSFWSESVYSKNNQARDIDPKQPKIVAFHSFTGGVGKTIHLAAYLLALLEHADERENPISILLIDADLSSPRISYWGEKKRTVSLINFLECYQSTNQKNVLSYFAQQLRDNKKRWKDNTVYTLPAFSSEHQLLDKNVLPQDLINDVNKWGYTDSIEALAKAVNADYIFMNLESGLSEGSAPILFDNRIHRFLITSPEISSLRGTEMILRYLGQSNPRSLGIAPTVIFNKMKSELCDELSKDIKARLRRAYGDTDLTHLIVETTEYFNRQYPGDSYTHLAVVSSWRDAMVRLIDTSIKELAQKWASNM